MPIIRFQLRRGTTAEWVTANPVLGGGEPGLETDTGKVKYGDGVSAWADRPYSSLTQGEMQSLLDTTAGSAAAAAGSASASAGSAAAASGSAADASGAAATALTHRDAAGDSAAAAAATAAAIPTTNDPIVKGLLDDPASQTAMALNATILDKASALTPTARYPMRAYGAALAKHLAGTAAQVKWMVGVDSMAPGIFERLFERLRHQFGGNIVGVYFTGSSRSVTNNASTGTITESTTAYDAWPTGIVSSFATGATRTYGVGGAAFTSNKIKVYYVKEAGAGTFKLQVDGVDAVGFENVSAVGTLGELGIATITPTLGAHTVTVVNLTGTVRIIGVGFENTTLSGIIPVSVYKGGLELPDAVGAASARSNYQAFVADVQPTVITQEMKEGTSTFDANLTLLLDIFKNGSPSSDVVLIASPAIGNDLTDEQGQQNTILRAKAAEYGYAVFDADKAFGTYEDALARGFYTAGDAVHYNTAGKDFLANLFGRDMNLFPRAGTETSTGKAIVETTLELGAIPTQRSLRLVDVSALDVLAYVQRALKFVKLDGVEDANSWLIQPNNSTNQQIPTGIRVGSAGPFLQSVLSGERLAIKSARGGGTTKDLEMRAVVLTGTGAYLGLPAVTTANRPTGIGAGASVFDTTLGKPVWYNGTAWVDATGTTV